MGIFDQKMRKSENNILCFEKNYVKERTFAKIGR